MATDLLCHVVRSTFSFSLFLRRFFRITFDAPTIFSEHIHDRFAFVAGFHVWNFLVEFFSMFVGNFSQIVRKEVQMVKEHMNLQRHPDAQTYTKSVYLWFGWIWNNDEKVFQTMWYSMFLRKRPKETPNFMKILLGIENEMSVNSIFHTFCTNGWSIWMFLISKCSSFEDLSNDV